MPVIGTREARNSPIAAPISTAATSSPIPSPSMPPLRASTTVETRAIAMPAMPKVLPMRAVSCRESPASARMNSSAATTYAALAMVCAVMEVSSASISCAGTCRACGV